MRLEPCIRRHPSGSARKDCNALFSGGLAPRLQQGSNMFAPETLDDINTTASPYTLSAAAGATSVQGSRRDRPTRSYKPHKRNRRMPVVFSVQSVGITSPSKRATIKYPPPPPHVMLHGSGKHEADRGRRITYPFQLPVNLRQTAKGFSAVEELSLVVPVHGMAAGARGG